MMKKILLLLAFVYLASAASAISYAPHISTDFNFTGDLNQSVDVTFISWPSGSMDNYMGMANTAEYTLCGNSLDGVCVSVQEYQGKSYVRGAGVSDAGTALAVGADTTLNLYYDSNSMSARMHASGVTSPVKTMSVAQDDKNPLLSLFLGSGGPSGTAATIEFDNLLVRGYASEAPVVALGVREEPGVQSDSVSMKKSVWSHAFGQTGAAGNYSFTVHACDIHGNCFDSEPYTFTMDAAPSACAGKNILVVSDNDSGFVVEDSSAIVVLNALGSYCPLLWETAMNGSPSLAYVQNFDAVVWSSGNRFAESIDANDAQLLIGYATAGGRLLLEGADIASENSYGDFNAVMHSLLQNEFNPIDYNTLSVNMAVRHPITSALPDAVQFDISASPYPDALALLDGNSLLEWSSGGAALVIYNGLPQGSSEKVVFIPFALPALGQANAQALIAGSVEWLLEGTQNPDISVDSLSFSPSWIVGGSPVNLSISLSNRGTQDSGSVPVDVVVDGSLHETLDTSIAAGATANLTSTLNLALGQHTVEVVANPDWAVDEIEYLNNSKAVEVKAVEAVADLNVLNVWYSPEMPSAEESVTLNAEIANAGGLDAANAVVDFIIDGNVVASQTANIAMGSSAVVSAAWFADQGTIGNLTVIADADNSIAETDESNNQKSTEIYVCGGSTEVVLVADDDAESAAGSAPDSAALFAEALKQGDYCFETWSERELGVPAQSGLASADVVVWSAGNRWNTAVDANDLALLNSLGKNLLIEGSDIAFDHSAGEAGAVIHAALESDVIADADTRVVLGSGALENAIFGQLAGAALAMDANSGPYPDAVSATDGTALASWNGNSQQSAIVWFASGGTKTIYLAFSIAGIADAAAGEQIVLGALNALKGNIAPEFGQMPDQNLLEDSEFNDNIVDLWQYAWDAESGASGLAFEIVSETNPEIAGCMVDSGRYLDCTAKPGRYGRSDLNISASDGSAARYAALGINVLAVNDAPAAGIASPADGANFACEQPISFSGSATDAEDGMLTGDSLEWSSDVSGLLGNGENISAVLPSGMHTITLTATDSQGGTGTDSATVRMICTDIVETQITTDAESQTWPAIYGSRIVWADFRNGNYDVYMYDISTGIETQITKNTGDQSWPAIYGDKIAYQDNRKRVKGPQMFNYDIYIYDLSTGTETRITTDAAKQEYPKIYGDRIVWRDNRNGNYDIYMYDLNTGTETQVTTDAGWQNFPAISGGRIVWPDNRNGNWDIYMYDISTGTETRVTTDPAVQERPAIYGNRIVWLDYRNGRSDIYMYDTSTGIEAMVPAGAGWKNLPAVYMDKIVYEDTRNGNSDIYLYDLSTSLETKITNDILMHAWPAIYGDNMVWHTYADNLAWQPGKTKPDIYMAAVSRYG